MVKKIKLFKAIFLAIAGISAFHSSNTNSSKDPATKKLDQIKNNNEEITYTEIKYEEDPDFKDRKITVTENKQGSINSLRLEGGILCSGNTENGPFFALCKCNKSQIYNAIELFNSQNKYKISCYTLDEKNDPQVYPVARTEI